MIAKLASWEQFIYLVKNRFLFRSLILILMNGLSVKSLELIRLSIHLRLVSKMTKRIERLTRSLEHNPIKIVKERHDRIWVCWFQGIENSPDIVKICNNSLRSLKDKNVTIITSENFDEYVNLPEHIIEKWKSGVISQAHFSDLLRLELLYKHGGIWLDATVFLSKKTLPSFLEYSSLFFYQPLKPGLDGCSINISSWAMSSVSNHPVLYFTRLYLHEYWLKKSSLEDYFLFHIVIVSVLKVFPEYCNQIDKVCNSLPHILQLEFHKEWNEERFEQIMALSQLHKLTYKFSSNNIKRDSNLYFILNRYRSEDV